MAQANEQQANMNAEQAEQKEKEAKDERDEAQRQRDEVGALNEKLRATETELRNTLYGSRINLAQYAWESGDLERLGVAGAATPQAGGHGPAQLRVALSQPIVSRRPAHLTPPGVALRGVQPRRQAPAVVSPGSREAEVKVWGQADGQGTLLLQSRRRLLAGL